MVECLSHIGTTSKNGNKIKKLLASLTLLPLLFLGFAVPAATAAEPRTTIVYSPHPDDETLRLAGYVSQALARGDRLVLVSVTGGGATNLTQRWGWTQQQMIAHRMNEQRAAWESITRAKGTIISLNLADGQVSNSKAVITAKVKQLQNSYGADVEHYVAASDNDAHPDHRAVVQAVKAANVPVVRVSSEPGSPRGQRYAPTYYNDAVCADRAYQVVGWPSVGSLFANWRNDGYASYISR